MLPLAADTGGSGPSGVAIVLAVAAALILALVLAEIVGAVLRGLGNRHRLPGCLARRSRTSVRALLLVLCIWWTVGLVNDVTPRWWEVVVSLAAVVTATWLLAVVLPTCTDAALDRHRLDAPGRRHARGSQALAGVVRRTARWLVLLAGLAGGLLVLDATRVAGLVVVAAVVLGLVVIGAAVVPALRDVAAGVELALTDAIRLDDVIAVDGEWGRVEEITATSVLLQAWDDRRVVVPTRRLTAAAFENWTRRTGDLVGTVNLDIGPGIEISAMRAELVRQVETNDLWDRRVAVLQVADAVGGRVRVRAMVSATDAPRLMDLRCDVREAMVEWLRVQVPVRGAPLDLPVRTRHTVDHPRPGTEVEVPDRTARLDPRRHARLFTGSVFAAERSQAFTGPGADVLAERDAAAGQAE